MSFTHQSHSHILLTNEWEDAWEQLSYNNLFEVLYELKFEKSIITQLKTVRTTLALFNNNILYFLKFNKL